MDPCSYVDIQRVYKPITSISVYILPSFTSHLGRFQPSKEPLHREPSNSLENYDILDSTGYLGEALRYTLYIASSNDIWILIYHGANIIYKHIREMKELFFSSRKSNMQLLTPMLCTAGYSDT